MSGIARAREWMLAQEVRVPREAASKIIYISWPYLSSWVILYLFF